MTAAVAKYVVDMIGRDAGLRKALEDTANGASAADIRIASMAKSAAGAAAVMGTVATVGIGVAAAVHNVAMENARLGRELEAQAVASNLTIQSIQEIGYATQSVGVDAGKAADIFKDWQDKLGEFRSSGGGEFADFFEQVGDKVGLSADELARMAGPEALIAVKKAMDDAGVSADRQISYLEALADDASKLTPLLENNGEAFRNMVKKYREMDVALTESELDKFKDYEQDITDLQLVWDDLSRNTVIPFVSIVADGARWMNELLGTSRAERMQDLREEMQGLANEIADLEVNGKKYGGGLTGMLDALMGETATKGERIAMRKSKIRLLAEELKELDDLSKTGGNLGAGYVPPELNDPPSSKTSDAVEAARKKSSAYLAQMDLQFSDEKGKLALQNEQRLRTIAELQVSEQELKRLGYESLNQLQTDYMTQSNQRYLDQMDQIRQREDEKHLQDLEKVNLQLLEKDQVELAAWERRQQILLQNYNRDLIDEQRFQELSTKNWEKYQKKLADLDKKKQLDQLKTNAALFGDLSGLAKTFAGEQSGIYKAMFAVQKGYSIKAIMLANQEALAKAWASAPFPANIPAVFTTAAKTGVLTEVANSLSYHTGGIAGLPSDNFGEKLRSGEVPAVLMRGEEVITERDPRHRDNLVASVGGSRIPNVQVINNLSVEAEASVSMLDGDNMQIILEAVDNKLAVDALQGTGSAPQAFEVAYGLNRGNGVVNG